MACSSCAKRRAMAVHNQPPMVVQRTQQISQSDFLQLHYIGVDGAIIPSTFNHVQYGYRNYGDIMYVAKIDFETFPGVWMTQDEFSNLNT